MVNRSVTIELLNSRNQIPYCNCLEEWSEEMKDSGDLKCRWVEYMADKGLGVLMARNQSGSYVGMIQYLPSDYSPVDAPGHYHIHCCWVHAYKGKGVGDWRGRGIGKALLEAAETNLRLQGAAGITAWGLSIPVWMKASWYAKQGYRKVDRDGLAALMWKPLVENALPPRWRVPSEKLKERTMNRPLKVISLVGGVCPAMNIGQERMRKLVPEYGDTLDFQRVFIRSPEDVRYWGITDGLFVNGRNVSLGPPPSVNKLRKRLNQELRRLDRR